MGKDVETREKALEKICSEKKLGYLTQHWKKVLQRSQEVRIKENESILGRIPNLTFKPWR